MAYAEQLGLYRHVGGNMRDGPICQPLAMRMSSFDSILTVRSC